MEDGRAISLFDGSFTRDVVVVRNDAAMKVISPWIPMWKQGDPTEVGNGFLVTPEYYPETGFTSDEHQVQAVTTRFATHHGGIAQGPFEAPIGTEIEITALYYHVEDGGELGDPEVWVGLSYTDRLDLLFDATMSTCEPTPASYGRWSMAHHRTTTQERVFYVVLFAHWRWRAALNCTLWDRAVLAYTLPGQRSELGGVIRLPWSGGILKVEVTFEPKEKT